MHRIHAIQRLLGLTCLLGGCSYAAPATPDAKLEITYDSAIDAATDAGVPSEGLRINELAANGDPFDWFEIVNSSAVPLDLGDAMYVDARDAFAKAIRLPAVLLAPSGRVVIVIDPQVAGFSLGKDEELWLYRVVDQSRIDSVDWAEGDSPANGSYARVPDITGPFRATSPATQATPNPSQ